MRLLPLPLLLSLAATAPLAAQENGFVARIGTDTLSVERVTRTGNRMEGEVLVRAPRVQRRLYAIEFGPAGFERATITVMMPGRATPLWRGVARFARDTITMEIQRDSATQTVRIPAPPGVIPLAGGSWAAHDFAIWRTLRGGARRAGADSLRAHLYELGAAQLSWLDVVRLGRDSVRLVDPNFTHRVAVNENGVMMAAVRPEQEFVVRRVPTPDFSLLTAAWAARERDQGPLGSLSPRDSLRATVAGATITVDYGRPSRRGRTIFGGVVPWNQVWRTGANNATRLTTDRPLELAGLPLAAGSYSLWTIPTPSGWTLVINSNADLSGTDHDPSRDVYRLPMEVTTLPQPVERFTISVTPEGQGGRLRLQWDTVEAAMPFLVR